MLGIFHSACGVLALLLGAGILLSTKGTPRHVRVGRAYVLVMLGLNLSALGIYHLTGGFNLFHIFALMSLGLTGLGWLQIRYRHRWRRWLWRHYQYMSWSYVGLVAATSNEAFVRIAPLKHLVATTTPQLPLLVAAAILILSALIIIPRQQRVLAEFGEGRQKT